MSFTLLLPILLAGAPGPEVKYLRRWARDAGVPMPARPAVAATDDPPLRIWINDDGRFVRGDRAQVQVWAEDDGYLVVLQTDTEGHLRVLFPTDPTDDSFLRGGKRYEVKSRGGRDAFDVGDDVSGRCIQSDEASGVPGGLTGLERNTRAVASGSFQ